GRATRAPGPEHRGLLQRETLAGRHRGAARGGARLCAGQGHQSRSGGHPHRGGTRHPVRPDRGLGAGGGALIGRSRPSQFVPKWVRPAAALIPRQASIELACFPERFMPSLPISAAVTPILLLIGSNAFMTTAWYWHLRYKETPLFAVILISWGLAFIE